MTSIKEQRDQPLAVWAFTYPPRIYHAESRKPVKKLMEVHRGLWPELESIGSHKLLLWDIRTLCEGILL